MSAELPSPRNRAVISFLVEEYGIGSVGYDARTWVNLERMANGSYQWGDDGSVAIGLRWGRQGSANKNCVMLTNIRGNLRGVNCNTRKDVICQAKSWTTVMNREYNDVLFNRPMAEYAAGFGDPAGDFWLGLDAIHALCPTARPCELVVEVSYTGSMCWFSKCVPRKDDGDYKSLYSTFAVANSTYNYQLTIGDFNSEASTAGDALYYHNGAKFSTLDEDHDTWGSNSCSRMYGEAGWWYRWCSHSALTGEWGAGGYAGLYWDPVTDTDSADSSRMLVRQAA